MLIPRSSGLLAFFEKMRRSVQLRLPRGRPRIRRDWRRRGTHSVPGLPSAGWHARRRPFPAGRRCRRGGIQRIVRNHRHGRRRRIVHTADRPENRRDRAIGRDVMEWTCDQPFSRESDRVERVGDDRQRLRIFVDVFFGILSIGVVVLRVRKAGEAEHEHGAETNCCSHHAINLSDRMRRSQPLGSRCSRRPDYLPRRTFLP
jgi:hypothetical protein